MPPLAMVGLGVQHLLAMFGSTVLVPLITGLSPAVALFTAGLGTLVFHLCTKGIVPVFMGSSFAFIAGICTVMPQGGVPAVQSGIIAAGLVYLVFALLAKLVGPERIRRLFPPVVTGPVIMVIGLSLTGVAVKDSLFAGGAVEFTWDTLCNAVIAIFTFSVMVIGMNREKGFWKFVPILVGIGAGYLLCVVLNLWGPFTMDFSPIANAPWFNIPYRNGFLSLPKLDWTAVLLLAPISLVTFMEHLGDITTNGAVVGKDFFVNPGLHRTLLGDGLATVVAGFLGGPANTTYSENTGVLATTKNYNPAVLRLAAYFAIVLGLIGKFGAILLTIPGPVKGGVELMLFGMIAAVGIRTIVEAKVDLTSNRNLSIMAGTLCVGIGLVAIDGVTITFGEVPVKFSALFIATIVGVVLNLVLPGKKEQK